MKDYKIGILKQLMRVFTTFFFVGLMLVGCTSCAINSENLDFDTNQVLKILFVGNSLTYYHNLPDTLTQLSVASGKDVLVEGITLPGVSLGFHSTHPETIKKIRGEKWDVVILQSSDISAFSDLYQKEIKIVNTLKGYIHQNHPSTQVIYQMISGLQNGVKIRELNGELVEYSYEEYIQKIKKGTLYIAQETDVVIAPVGWAWRRARIEHPGIILFASDNAHPAPIGSFLGACVFYTTIFKEGLVLTDFESGFSSEETRYLQDLANRVVLDDLELWRIN